MAKNTSKPAPKGFIALVKSTRSKTALAKLYHSFLAGSFRATNPKTIRRQRRALSKRVATIGLPVNFA